MNELQILYLWQSQQEQLEYRVLSAHFKRFFPNEDLVAGLNYLQSARLVGGGMGLYHVTSKGWKARHDVEAPVEVSLPKPPLADSADPSPGQSGSSTTTRDSLTSISFVDSESDGPIQVHDNTGGSPWGLFRKLIGYYLDCVRCDERPSNVLGADNLCDTYIPIMTAGAWWPTGIQHDVQLTIPVPDGHHHAFVRRVLLDKEDFFFGYPIHSLGADENKILIPVFCVPATKVRYIRNRLEVTLDFNNADINASWLEKRFRTNDERQAFLLQCGLVDQFDEDAEFVEENAENGAIPDQLKLDVEAGISALKIFCADSLQEALSPMVTNPLATTDNLQRGIYNTAVMFSGKKLRFNIGLLKELGKIHRASDAELNQTALRHVFLTPEASAPGADVEGDQSDSLPVIPFVPFNYEQEEAVKLALENELTVITGPPGTGKSQVVVNLLANLAIRNKTALFASKNHKAIDAVVPRTNALVETGNLMTRLKNPETGDVFTWKNAVDTIMATVALPYDESCDVLREEVVRKLRRRDRLLDDAELWSSCEQKLAQLNEELDFATSGFSPAHVKSALAGECLVTPAEIVALRKHVAAIPKTQKGLSNRLRVWIWTMFRRKSLSRGLFSISNQCNHYQLEAVDSDHLIASKQYLIDVCDKLSKIHAIHELGRKIEAAEETSRDVKPLSESLGELTQLMDAVGQVTGELISKSVKNRFSGLDSFNLQEMVQMRGILNNMNAAGVGGQARINWERFFENSFSKLLKFFPMWAVPNLSVRHGLPLIAGVVDTVIIDEASQCDIVSIIPLLFRAKTAVVVGDPQQLKPVHRMGKGVNMQLMRRHNLIEEQNIFSYSYLDSSCFQLAASNPKCNGKVQLKDHYRCHPDIAYYFNDQFYGKSLRVLTNQTNLKVPKGYTVGLMWTDVVGETERVSTSGAICPAEISAIVAEIKSLLNDRGFDGSIGVVSPFRIQADRIRDAVYREIGERKLADAKFVCSTADGFQGDERDVILMSCVYQPNLYDGGQWYLTDTETRNLWNVGVSRARAALHIFGNKEFCKHSSASHLSALAKYCTRSEESAVPTGQFDSIWERKFHDALKDAGIETVSQYPLVGRRLDLAIPSLRMNLEVDGEKYHKDSSGRRKAEDLWRDMTIRAAGWMPMRFWVYELRENMDACVAKVADKIKELHGAV